MKNWNIKTTAAFQKEWRDHKDEHSTDGYDTLKSPFEIYLPFWKCKQNIVVEKDLEMDRFSKILLDLISIGISSHSEICRFLGIDEDNFCTMQLTFLENHRLIELVDSNYKITPGGFDFLEDRSKPKTRNTEEFDYMAKEKIDFLRNDMTSDFFDPLSPIDDNRNSIGKNNNFSGYKILETHKIQGEIKDKVYIQHSNNPTYRKIADKRTDFADFFNKMNPGKAFYDFVDSEFESHKRNICFLGFWYEKEDNPDDRKIDIRQFEKSVEKFEENELERELSKKVTDHVIKNEIRVGKADLPKEVQKETEQKEFKFCPECGKELKITAKFCTKCGTKQEEVK